MSICMDISFVWFNPGIWKVICEISIDLISGKNNSCSLLLRIGDSYSHHIQVFHISLLIRWMQQKKIRKNLESWLGIESRSLA